ncbi:hypothetical protein JSY14_07170 [Brachybacterium sp. EF45031]|uniref:hypothetical protein n=1 Tax=Brachybacterium sillae TaxID=2810536 RepID=UPI00217CF03D|nr:hypothetical protein [Brachybacterium sillae]MCS6711812.1 hypothetical protein [Brachybacterium sillae]
MQNLHNLSATRDDALIEELAHDGIPYVAFLPLQGRPDPATARRMQHLQQATGAPTTAVILALLLARHPNLLVIPGTSSVAHLEENLRAREVLGAVSGLE